jgi:DNA polymerase elongation subunit (family B)
VGNARNVGWKNGVKKGGKIVLDIETASLSPTEGRIICIGIMESNSGEYIAFCDPDEEEMVRRFISYSESNGFKEIIGYNLLFDIRFIFAKCLKYEIPARRFFSLRYTDLMMILKSAGRRIYNFNKPGTLDEWSNFLFDDRKVSDSSTLPTLYQEGKIGIEEVVEHNRKDVELTYRLWKRIRYVLNGEGCGDGNREKAVNILNENGILVR